MHRLRIAFLIAAPLAFGAVPAVVAQESAASPTPIAATECTVDPFAYDDLSHLLATPVADPSPTVEASPTAVVMPEGELADGATTRAVHETVQQLTACLNAGDLLRGLSLYSDQFIQSAFSGFSITQQMYDEQLKSVEPRDAGNEVVLYSFGDVVITKDGRAAVVVVGDDQASEGPASATLFYLVQDGDRWLIDETVEDVQESGD